MEKKNSISTRRIVLAALLAALTVVGSGIRIKVPLELTGTTAFHLGNIMCALSGILLGPWLGGLAAGLGSAIYDMFDPYYIQEAWITFQTKAAYGMAVGLVLSIGKKKWSQLKATLATAAGAVVYALLYLSKGYLQGIWVQGLTPDAALLNLLGKVPATVFNGVVAIIFAPLLASAIRKALERSHLLLD